MITFEIGNGVGIGDDQCQVSVEVGVYENCVVRSCTVGIRVWSGFRHRFRPVLSKQKSHRE